MSSQSPSSVSQHHHHQETLLPIANSFCLTGVNGRQQGSSGRFFHYYTFNKNNNWNITQTVLAVCVFGLRVRVQRVSKTNPSKRLHYIFIQRSEQMFLEPTVQQQTTNERTKI